MWWFSGQPWTLTQSAAAVVPVAASTVKSSTGVDMVEDSAGGSVFQEERQVMTAGDPATATTAAVEVTEQLLLKSLLALNPICRGLVLQYVGAMPADRPAAEAMVLRAVQVGQDGEHGTVVTADSTLDNQVRQLHCLLLVK